MSKVDAQMFRSLGQEELTAVVESLPTDPNLRFVIFMEALRVVDYWTVFQGLLPAEKRMAESDFQLLQWGWNRAAAHLLTPLQVPGAIPIRESTMETRSYAMTLLHQLGRSVLMHRSADMLECGFLVAEQTDNGFVVRKANDDISASTFADLLEFSRLEELERTIGASGSSYKDWQIFDPDDSDLPSRVGNFLGRRNKEPFKKLKRFDIDSLMLPLIRPWESGHGTMMGYGAEPEVDYHFLAEALENVSDWRSDAGLHPNTTFGQSTGADITLVAVVLIGLHLKHIRFALVASKHHPKISIPQSLTIWGPEADLARGVSEFTGLDLVNVQTALDVITLRPHEVSFLQSHSTPFMPLLFGLGNGVIVRPVSSLARNPLLSITTLVQWRDPAAVNALLKPREEWLRSEIYALFQGRRYECISGSVKLREKKKVVTDVDATIFDRVTGELALFQIKWQDYHTNDVRQLRSRARTLAGEMDDWAESVTEWLLGKDGMTLAKNLRLSTRKNRPFSAIYLFGISRSTARTHGYGYPTKHPSLALANWPQFHRVRSEVGPAERVFHDMHLVLQTETHETVDARPMPVDVTVAGRLIRFEDLWVALNTEDDEGAK